MGLSISEDQKITLATFADDIIIIGESEESVGQTSKN